MVFKKGEAPWNKGKTKETDPCIAKYGNVQSKTKKKLFSEGILVIWSKGQTKETHPSVKSISDSLTGRSPGTLGKTWKWPHESRAKQSERMLGNTPWNKGRSADPDSPNYDPRVALNGRNTLKTNKQRHPNLWKRIGRNGGIASWANLTPEQRSERNKEVSLSRSKEVRRETGIKNIKSAHKQLRSLSPKERSDRASRAAMSGTYEERSSRASKAGVASIQSIKSPNHEEKRLEKILAPYGFIRNVKQLVLHGWSNIFNRTRRIVPDFLCPNIPVVIQNDGWLGHNPNSPIVSKNVLELDNERDEICRGNGYDVISVTPSDHKYSDEQLLELIRDRLNVFGYSLRNLQ